MFAHPVGTAVSSGRGFVRLLIGPGRAELFRVVGLSHPSRLGGVRTLVFAMEALLLLVLLVGALCGTVLSFVQRRWRVLAIGGGFAGYLVVIASNGAAYSRYRAPAAPYLALLAGFAGAWLVTRVMTRSASPSPSAGSDDAEPQIPSA
jgi:hypothetical protein